MRSSSRTLASRAPKGSSRSKHLGPRRQRPRQGHPLALAARELRRVTAGVAGKLDQLEQLVDPCFDLGLGKLPHLQAERDVLADRHVAEQRVVLEDEPDAPLLHRQLRRVLAGQLDAAGVGRLQPGDDPQDRALARSRRPQQGDELPGRHLERDVLHRLEGAIPLREILYLDAHG